MREIHKFKIPSGSGTFKVSLPCGGVILTVQTQFDSPCLWVLFMPDSGYEDRIIHVFGTGHPIPDDLKLSYISTYQQAVGHLIWHVFEEFE